MVVRFSWFADQSSSSRFLWGKTLPIMMMLMKSALKNHVVGSMIQVDHLCSAVTCKLLCKLKVTCTTALSLITAYRSLSNMCHLKGMKILKP